ncbi:unnamed protein product [Gulo gulo]|uniref:Uncharacterized protein n=1 Tax=Gulo gulo TaxID=48420 RepID=A0A9X9PYF2_GULGU|nr:unnamed protein product [Gulo gulo]
MKHVSFCYFGKLHHPSCYDRALLARAHVLLPIWPMLVMSDMGLSSSLHTMGRIFLFHAPEISSNAYIAQEFFTHGFTVVESSVLLIMSFNHFLATHSALRYSSILTPVRVAKIGMALFFKHFLMVLPLPFSLRSL